MIECASKVIQSLKAPPECVQATSGHLSHLVFCVAAEEQGAPMTVELEKGAGGIGFTLEGGKGSIHGDRPLVINRIFTGTLFRWTFNLVFSDAMLSQEKGSFRYNRKGM